MIMFLVLMIGNSSIPRGSVGMGGEALNFVTERNAGSIPALGAK